jgi:hypothetical protein
MKQAHELVKAARVQLDAIGLKREFTTQSGNGEVVIVAEENGIWLRGMVDWTDKLLPLYVDLKTSGKSAAPQAVPFTMADAGWHIQCAMQERILDAIDPDHAGRRKFIFVMVENMPPYALTANQISEAVLTLGRKQLDHAIRIWRNCIERNSWPAYPPIVNVPEYPGYKESQWLKREIAEEDAWTGDRLQSRETMLTDLMGG